MVGWQSLIKGNPVDWLLERDEKNPAVRYLALRDLQSMPEDSPELIQARSEAFAKGTVAIILDRMRPEGYWVKSGGGYGPKFTGSVWSLVSLAQMGADATHPDVRRAAEYLLAHTISPIGWMSYNGTDAGLLHCHAGYLASAMLDLGLVNDSRVMNAIEWQARLVVGEGIAAAGAEPTARYYRYTPGPDFACSANDGKPCAWGAVKALNAMSKIPSGKRSLTMNQAIDRGHQLLLGTDLMRCDFPTRDKTGNRSAWFKPGFPMFYASDVLEVLEVLTRLGDGANDRLQSVWALILDKQDDEDKWLLESSYNGRMWADIEEKGQPSKWVTLRAIRTLKAAFPV